MGKGKDLFRRFLSADTPEEVPGDEEGVVSEETIPPEEEETSKKRDRDTDKKQGAKAHKKDLKEIVDHVIEDEERTLQNYLSPRFWLEKRQDIKEIRKKEKQGRSVYEVLEQGANPTREYYILTILSCVIATVGLIQGATATVIGAMIVAPLMTPILAFSLGVLWGDIYLIRRSLGAIFLGSFIAVAISTLIALVVPMGGYSTEILARTEPSLFDILVALASGLIGAYGYGNERISNTVVGIAIAVALMPPLCVIGIGIGTFNMSIAYGAFILFLINLISIGLAGALVFWFTKIHPPLADEEKIKRRAMSQIFISGAILLAIAVPLGLFMIDGYRQSKGKETVRQTLEDSFPALQVFKVEARDEGGQYLLEVALTGAEKPDRAAVETVTQRLLAAGLPFDDLRIVFFKSEVLSPKGQAPLESP